MAKSLPQFQTADKDVGLMQNKWASILNPILTNPLNNTVILNDVILVVGTNSVPHLLQRKIKGWFIVGIDNAATIYDLQKNNQRPDLTIDLVSSNPCTVQLAVF
jgi:hypothetical protein